jgi:hypothetical protein
MVMSTGDEILVMITGDGMLATAVGAHHQFSSPSIITIYHHLLKSKHDLFS